MDLSEGGGTRAIKERRLGFFGSIPDAIGLITFLLSAETVDGSVVGGSRASWLG